MELTTDSAEGNSESARSFTIDLNESPSFSSSSSDYLPTDAFSVVRRFHDDLSPPHGAPAELPRVFEGSLCPACGKPEDRKCLVVCDGCERGFHLSCAFMHGKQMEDWKCGECICNAVPCNRWPLGVKTKSLGQKQGNVRLLDINSLPISDGEGEGTTDVPHFRKRTPGDNSFGVPVHAEKGFNYHKASTFVPNNNNIRASSESKLPHKQVIRRIFEEVDSNSVTNHHPVKMHLHTLREYVLERHGVLDEGWHVEFKQSIASGELHPVYCAPGGKTFESMAEVASYLGSNSDNMRPTVGCHAPAPPQQNPSKKNCGSAADVCFRKSGNNVRVPEVATGDTGGNESHRLSGRLLPVQYEDFFVLSIGKIASSSSYHSENQIWPVGYKSCWHDKITGSLFISEVCDDGEFGPVFKVTRRSCFSVPIPEASNVICSPNPVKSDPQNNEKHNDITFRDTDYDGDSNLLMILSEPSPPGEDDVLSCLGTGSVSEQSNSLRILPDSLGFTDEIGEFSVEGSSSSSAWSMVSKTLIHVCRRTYMQTGTLKFFCKHAEDIACEKDEDIFVSLAKFRGISNSVKIPSFIGSYTELETLNEVLTKWIDQDRFGLDADFVQEIVEQLPGAKACSSYIFLNERSSYASSLMVENGNLVIQSKDTDDPVVNDHCLPPGNPISSRVPPQLLGDVLQVSEFLGRFYNILDLKEPLSVIELEKELVTPWFEGLGQELGPTSSVENPHTFIQMGKQATIEAEQPNIASISYSGSPIFALTKVHNSLMKTLVTELQSKVVTVENPKLDNGEVKLKRGRKKDNDSFITAKRVNLITLPLNELTWPELARRYILSVLAMDGNHDSPEVITRETAKVSRCLQGDGGVLCGPMTGVAGIEADAQLLAEASKKIFGSLKKENNILFIEEEEEESDVASSSNKFTMNNGDVPEWAKVLEPVRKLPTNVGARIKRCVNEALEKCPPEWAKKILEHSISKEVYKGNASGPTKKAVLSILEKLNTEGFQQKPVIVKKKKSISISDIIMKKCRIILRRAAAADEDKIICNLLGRKLINCSDNNDDEGILGSPAAVSRSLDFRTIDLRLAVGVYGGSHEAFVEDVREFWTNVSTAYADQSDMVELAQKLSSNFKSLYEDEVVTLFYKLVGYTKLETLSADSKKEVDELLSSSELPKAPWEEGVCKVCGVDRDDNSVLLCDTCDAEYHFYCLNPPLARIPEGNWYCPSCVAGKNVVQDSSKGIKVIRRKKIEGEFTCVNMDTLSHLATALEERDHWDLSVEERTLLLKFLCDELLNSALIRQHLEKSAEASADLQQKLRSLYVEWKTLKSKEEKLTLRAARIERSSLKSSVQLVVGESSGNAITNDTQILRVDSIGESQSACNSSVQVADSVPLDLDQGDINESDPQDRSASFDNLQSDGIEINSVKNEILLLQKSITGIETELMKLSSRREFLGRDSFGRLYWILAEWGPQPSLTANGNVEFHPRGKIMCYSDANPISSTWVSYESVAEIKELVNCLNENDPWEKELKESILHWQKLGFHEDERENDVYRSINSTNSKEFCTDLIAKATSLLETMYGPCFQPQAIDSSKKRSRKSKLNAEPPKMYRCECLEPVWQSRNHCVSCHKTFFNSAEFEKHSDGKCNTVPPTSDKTKDTEIVKGKGTMKLETGPKSEPNVLSNPNLIKFQNDSIPCPFKFEEICSKFVIKSSNKELVKEIGLIGSNGVPSFVSSLPPYLSDPALMLVPSQENVTPKSEENLCSTNTESFDQLNCTLVDKYSSSRCDVNDVSEAQKGGKADTRSYGSGIIEVNCCVVPEAALKPLIGKDFNILKQLKIILLDMDAVLSEEALRPSKINSERRRAWCEFVKSAQTIYEMVQALMVLEDAIKSEYLTNTWWYWSSLSAAAKISTLSALALRIYSLDASINYDKISSDNAPLNKPISENLHPSSDSAEKTKPICKSTKKRKESEV